MAYFGFTNKLRQGETIQIFNYGNCKRDFTYIDDIVEGIVRVMQHAPEKAIGEDGLPIPPYALYNIGQQPAGEPAGLRADSFGRIGARGACCRRITTLRRTSSSCPCSPADVPVTYADTSALERDFGFKPATPLREGAAQGLPSGIRRFT